MTTEKYVCICACIKPLKLPQANAKHNDLFLNNTYMWTHPYKNKLILSGASSPLVLIFSTYHSGGLTFEKWCMVKNHMQLKQCNISIMSLIYSFS